MTKTKTKTKTNTKRVRIAVAVDRDCSWFARKTYLADSIDDIRDSLDKIVKQGLIDAGYRLSIVEADVPMPEEPAVVRGELVDG